MVRLPLGAAALIASLALPAFAHAEKLAFVNLRRAMHECSEGKEIQRKLSDEVKSKEKDLNEKREVVKKLSEDLRAQESTLAAAEAEKRRGELRTKYFELERMTAAAKDEIAKHEASFVRPLSEKLMVAVAAVAQREKVTYVLRADALLWSESQAMDLTNDVIRLANVAFEKEKGGKAEGASDEKKDEKKDDEKKEAAKPEEKKDEGKAE